MAPARIWRQSPYTGGFCGLEMAHRLLYFNADHSRLTQDLLMQIMVERECEIVIVAELYRVLRDNPS